MHTEHLRNVNIGWVIAGWLIAAATTGLVALALVALNVATAAATVSESLGARWAVIAVAVGFFVGGLAVGYRTAGAPILTGICIGLATLAVWLPLNFVIDFIFDIGPWEALTPTLTVLVLLIQTATAMAGTWLGYQLAMRGDSDIFD